MNNTVWDLEKLLPRSKFNQAIIDVKIKLELLKKDIENVKISITANEFVKLIRIQEEIVEDLTVIFARAELEESTNVLDMEAKQMVASAKDLLVFVNDVLRPFDLWLKGRHRINGELLDSENAVRLFKTIPQLEYYLTNEREKGKYTLNENQEAIIIRKDMTGSTTLIDLRDLLETKQEYTLSVEGVEKKFNNIAQLAPYFHSSKREFRKGAYDCLLKEYISNRIEYFLIYQALVKDWNNEKDLRGYDSAIAIRNVENGIDN